MSRSWLGPGVSTGRLAWLAAAVWLVGGMSAWPAAGQEAATDDPPAIEAEASGDKAVQPAEGTTAPPAEESPPDAAVPEASGPAGGDVERLFSDYLHFAIIGQFEYAAKAGQALLARAELNPLSDESADLLVELSRKYASSVDTLMILASNSTLGESAAAILDLVRQAHARRRMNAGHIAANIQLLSGTPTQRAVAMERLTASGEYAVPLMLEVIADPAQKQLQPFVARALSLLGRKAVNPLAAATFLDVPVVQRAAAEALGEIGYPQALPYLKRLAEGASGNAEIREAAATAVRRIVVADPGVREAPAADLFADLAGQYYREEASLRADPREPRVNVWRVREGRLAAVEVPRGIFTTVMCMDCCEAAMQLKPQAGDAAALWLAANLRREARLGLNVEAVEDAAADDPTRPKGFPRAVYFARSAGPEVCLRVLARAIADRDRPVALGAIAGLDATAGPAAMLGTRAGAAASLIEALSFPDQLVRIKAALALGRAMPAEPFGRSGDVVDTLAAALSLTGRKAYLLVDPDESSRRALQADLADGDRATVVAADRLEAALIEAHRKLNRLDGVFLASDIRRPGPAEAVAALSADETFAIAPVVLYVKEGGMPAADRVAETDARVGRVLVVTGDPARKPLVEELLARLEEIAPRYAYRPVEPAECLDLALQAAGTLRQMAIARPRVFDVGRARPALIAALAHPAEELRIAAAGVLALLDDAEAQSAVARTALDAGQSGAMRRAAYAALADSARRFGARLDGASVEMLVEQSISQPDLALRTAASQALGAMNLPGPSAAQIILKQSRP